LAGPRSAQDPVEQGKCMSCPFPTMAKDKYHLLSRVPWRAHLTCISHFSL